AAAGASRAPQSATGHPSDPLVIGTTVNEFRASYVTSLPSASAAAEPSVSVVRTNYSTEGGSSYSWVRTETWQLADQLAAERGRHELKFGGDFTREKVADFGYTTFGEYRFAPGPPRPDEKYLDFT